MSIELAILQSAESSRTRSLDRLVQQLAAQPAEVLEFIEQIDDLVFEAIDGSPQALANLQLLWPLAWDRLDRELVEQSREQYLRCALSIWNECIERRDRRPERAVAAIDVLCVLFDD